MEPIDRIEPVEPMDRIEPAEPMDRIEPDDPIDRIEPADPIDATLSTLRTEPALAADHAESADATLR